MKMGYIVFKRLCSHRNTLGNESGAEKAAVWEAAAQVGKLQEPAFPPHPQPHLKYTKYAKGLIIFFIQLSHVYLKQ